MELRDVILVALKAMGGKVSGKTLLQKRLYLVGVLTGEDFGFRSHYYGPYSDFVSSEVTQLTSIGALSEKSSPWGVDGSGFEMTRYDYQLTEFGEEAAARAIERNSEEAKRIEEAIGRILAAGELDYQKLSIAAKVFFIVKDVEGGVGISEAEIVDRAKKLNWNLTEDKIVEAAQYLVSLKLVKASE